MVEIARCKCGELPGLTQIAKTTLAYECPKCAMKDEEMTERRFRQHVLGEDFDA